MEKGPSTYAQYWTSEYNEIKHFRDHGKQMGFDKIVDYSRAAVEFAFSDSESLISFTTADGSIFQYDPKTNEFLILSRNGKIVTYYPPSKGLKYFNNQFEKYGIEWIKKGE